MTQALAQLNIARLKAPLDSPLLADFVANLDRINALAERSPGYVWRLQTDDGNATAHRPTVAEARGRLELLRAQGPTADAFTFRRPFPPPGAMLSGPLNGLDDLCPAQ